MEPLEPSIATAISPTAEVNIPGMPADYVKPPQLVPEASLQDWLDDWTESNRKVVLANRYLELYQVTQLLANQLRRSYFIMSDDITKIVGAQSTFVPGSVPAGYQIPAGLTSQYFDTSYVPADAILLYEGNYSDLSKIETWPGNVVYIVGFGIDMMRSLILLRQSGSSVIRAVFPRKLELKVVVEQVIMSNYQKAQFDLATANENLAGRQAGASMALGIVSPTRVGRGGHLVASPTRKVQYESKIRLRARQQANMAYPINIQLEYNKSDKKNRHVLPDKLQTQGGWMDASFFAYLGEYSNKMVRLFTRLLARQRAANSQNFIGRFIVPVSFLHHHGLEILLTTATYLGIPAAGLMGSLNPGQRFDLVSSFNKSAAGVLLISSELKLTPEIQFYNIDELIVFDATDRDTVYQLIDSCFRETHYPEPKIFQTVFLISRLSESQATTDGEAYNKFREEEDKKVLGYHELDRYAGLIMQDKGQWVVAATSDVPEAVSKLSILRRKREIKANPNKPAFLTGNVMPTLTAGLPTVVAVPTTAIVGTAVVSPIRIVQPTIQPVLVLPVMLSAPSAPQNYSVPFTGF